MTRHRRPGLLNRAAVLAVSATNVAWFPCIRKPRPSLAGKAGDTQPNEWVRFDPVRGRSPSTRAMPATGRTQYVRKPLPQPVEVTVPPPRAHAKSSGNMTRPVEVMPDGYVSDARPTAKQRRHGLHRLANCGLGSMTLRARSHQVGAAGALLDYLKGNNAVPPKRMG